jgi:hypothetical protein
VLEYNALRNSSLQGDSFMLAARALGLDCGPMSGFDNAKVDAAFFAGTTVKSNFLCNLGYGDPSKLYPPWPRLEFEEACKIVRTERPRKHHSNCSTRTAVTLSRPSGCWRAPRCRSGRASPAAPPAPCRAGGTAATGVARRSWHLQSVP